MEKLNKAYEAIELLNNLGLPVSSEQQKAIQELEKDYLRQEVIPLIESEMEPLVENIKNPFQIEISYTKEEGLSISMIDRISFRSQILSSDEQNKRQKKYITLSSWTKRSRARIICLHIFIY